MKATFSLLLWILIGTHMNDENYQFCTTFFSLDPEELYQASVVVSTDPQATQGTKPCVPPDDILRKKKVPELRQLAQQLNIRKTSTLLKRELVIAISRERDVSDENEPTIEAALPLVASLNSNSTSPTLMELSPETSDAESETGIELEDPIGKQPKQPSVIFPAVTRDSKQCKKAREKYLKQKAEAETREAILVRKY